MSGEPEVNSYRHDLPCQGVYWCLYGLPNFGERGEVATCDDCGRTAVCLGGDSWRRESTTERRRRLGLRWWQRTPPVPAAPEGSGSTE